MLAGLRNLRLVGEQDGDPSSAIRFQFIPVMMEDIILGREVDAIDRRELVEEGKADFSVAIHLIDEKRVISRLPDYIERAGRESRKTNFLTLNEYVPKIDRDIVARVQRGQEAVRFNASYKLFSSLAVVHNASGRELYRNANCIAGMKL